MVNSPKPDSAADRFLSLLRVATADDSGNTLAPMTHCLPVRVPDAEVPITFTVYLIPDARGTFLVTCRELPDLMTHGDDERDALARAEKAIKAILATHSGSPEIPSE